MANHYELEVFLLKKKLAEERTEREQRLAVSLIYNLSLDSLCFTFLICSKKNVVLLRKREKIKIEERRKKEEERRKS